MSCSMSAFPIRRSCRRTAKCVRSDVLKNDSHINQGFTQPLVPISRAVKFFAEVVGHLRVAKERHAPQTERVVTIRQAAKAWNREGCSGHNDREELSHSSKLSRGSDRADRVEW